MTSHYAESMEREHSRNRNYHPSVAIVRSPAINSAEKSGMHDGRQWMAFEEQRCFQLAPQSERWCDATNLLLYLCRYNCRRPSELISGSWIAAVCCSHSRVVDRSVPSTVQLFHWLVDGWLEFAGLENNGLEIDGVEQEQTYYCIR